MKTLDTVVEDIYKEVSKISDGKTLKVTEKELDAFAEGMKSFEELDGKKLIEAGKGMAAVAGGMAAFGVGTAVAGLGSLVGGITSGIVSLFGGDDPLTKMEKFQEYDFDEVRINSNAEAMVAFG